MRYNTSPPRSSRLRYDTVDLPIDEEDESSLDLATLMRKRRESMKGKRRESGPAVRQYQSTRNVNGVTIPGITVPIDDPSAGYTTDVEK